MATATPTDAALPRVTIRYCTQCKWMLRAAYYAQELLSTFASGAAPALAEVALRPGPSGTFAVDVDFAGAGGAALRRCVWDRRVDGGFPETKELKRRVRDLVDPGRGLGHVDGHRKAEGGGAQQSGEAAEGGGARLGHGAGHVEGARCEGGECDECG